MRTRSYPSRWDSARASLGRHGPPVQASNRMVFACPGSTSTSPGATSQSHGVNAASTESLVGCPRTSATVVRGLWDFNNDVAFPCGSRSTTSVASPFTVADPANPSTTDVLPTPPFKLRTLTTVMAVSLSGLAARHNRFAGLRGVAVIVLGLATRGLLRLRGCAHATRQNRHRRGIAGSFDARLGTCCHGVDPHDSPSTARAGRLLRLSSRRHQSPGGHRPRRAVRGPAYGADVLRTFPTCHLRDSEGRQCQEASSGSPGLHPRCDECLPGTDEYRDSQQVPDRDRLPHRSAVERR